MTPTTLTWLGLLGLGTALGWPWLVAVEGGGLDRLNGGPGISRGRVLAALLWAVFPGVILATTFDSDFTGLFVSAYLTAGFFPLFIFAAWGDSRVFGLWVGASWYLVAIPLGAWVVQGGTDLETHAALELHAHLLWLATVGVVIALAMVGVFVASAVGSMNGTVIYDAVRRLFRPYLFGDD